MWVLKIKFHQFLLKLLNIHGFWQIFCGRVRKRTYYFCFIYWSHIYCNCINFEMKIKQREKTKNWLNCISGDQAAANQDRNVTQIEFAITEIKHSLCKKSNFMTRQNRDIKIVYSGLSSIQYACLAKTDVWNWHLKPALFPISV